MARAHGRALRRRRARGGAVGLVRVDGQARVSRAPARRRADAPRGRAAGRAHARAVAVPRQGAGPHGASGAPSRGRLTYHDSCHLLRGLHESREPARAAARASPAPSSSSCRAADECCGFGGSFSVRLPEVSTAILDKKLANVEATGADCVVACDAGCLMQMRGGLSRRGSRVRAAAPGRGARPGEPQSVAVSEPAPATPFRERAGRGAPGRLPPGGAHHRDHQVHRAAPRGLRRVPRGRGAARPGPRHQGGHAPAPRPATSSGSSTTSSGAAVTCTTPPPPRRRARSCCDIARRTRRPDGREVEVDGHRGDPPQRGAGGGGRDAGRDRPRRVHHPARPRAALAHHRARHPQDEGAGGRAVRARAQAARRADPEVLTRDRARPSCARSSWRPTWGSPAPTSRWPRRARWCWSPTRATAAW